MTLLETQLTEQVQQLTETVAHLNQTITELNQTIAELRERLNKNSRNSSKPPSTDGYEKPNPKSLRKPSGRKAGGQNGHKGHHLNIEQAPSKIVSHMPAACAGCLCYEECRGKACVAETRKIADAFIEIQVTAHETLRANCPITGKTIRGSFPSDIKGPIQYGKTLQGLVVAFSTVGAVSAARIKEIFGSLFQIPLSTGTVNNIVHRFAEGLKTAGVIREIREQIIGSPLGNFDETGSRVEGELRWVHVASNSKFTHLHFSDKRGTDGMAEVGVLPYFHGTGIHDCWKSYWKYEMQHGICCAHLLRELRGIQENKPDQLWPYGFDTLLLEMKHQKEAALAEGKDSLPPKELVRLKGIYDVYLALAYQENPEPVRKPGKRGKPKRGKILALIGRFRDYKDCICRFIDDFTVPFDNNQAERDVRMVKIKGKVSGCLRTQTGAEDYLDIMSYIGTAKKQGVNSFRAILAALSGQAKACW